jgi:UDP-N-acetylmuramate dehydrogenase
VTSVAEVATLDALAAELERALPGRVARDVPVASLTTYRLGGPLAVVARAERAADLAVIAGHVDLARVPVLVVGRGSNLLVADRGFAGLGILLAGDFELVEVDPSTAVVRAGAAAPLPLVARRAAAVGVAGLEFLVGIPGSVGGAVRMNAGGHGSETRDVLHRAWIVSLDHGSSASPVERSRDELGLRYRGSHVGAHDVVTAAELTGHADAPGACSARVDEVVRWRREHQPGGANAGSVFRNPEGDSAGRLIDAAGCKGLRVGGAVVSPKHANFFQAEQGATADDVHRLVDTVRQRVADRWGIVLEPELRMLGFDEASAGPGAPR